MVESGIKHHNTNPQKETCIAKKVLYIPRSFYLIVWVYIPLVQRVNCIVKRVLYIHTSFYVNSIVSQLGKASICISALILDKLYIPGQNFPEINWYNQSCFILKC